MPGHSPIKPASKAIHEYRETLANYGARGVVHESALRSAFQTLLDKSLPSGWMLVPEQAAPAAGRRAVRPDGTVHDANGLPRGYWEELARQY